jgi:hypothetical protein
MEWMDSTEMSRRDELPTDRLEWWDGVLMQEWCVQARLDGQWRIRYEWRPVPTREAPPTA